MTNQMVETCTTGTLLGGFTGAVVGLVVHRTAEMALTYSGVGAALSFPLSLLWARRGRRTHGWTIAYLVTGVVAVGAITMGLLAGATSRPPATRPQVLHGYMTLLQNLINKERAKAGCGKLALDPALMATAAEHSQDMAENSYFSRADRGGADVARRFARSTKRTDIEILGENIASGYEPRGVIDGWLHSPAHRKTMLDCDADVIGISGIRNSSGTTYWTTDYGRFTVPR